MCAASGGRSDGKTPLVRHPRRAMDGKAPLCGIRRGPPRDWSRPKIWRRGTVCSGCPPWTVRRKGLPIRLRTGAKPILTVDRDGSILLSMARTTETSQARFWHDEQGYHPQRIAPLAGKLHRPIVVDDVDYASVLETASHLQVSRATELDTLGSAVACPCEATCGELL